MKEVFYNPARKAIQEKIQAHAEKEAQTKEAYFKSLQQDPNFKKYILEGILNKHIQKNKEIGSQFDVLLGKPAEYSKDILLSKASALKQCEKIREAIVRHWTALDI